MKTGLDLFEEKWPPSLQDARVGLLVHPASVNRQLEHAVDLFHASKKCKLNALFGAQHGIRGETQDNMIEWEGFVDRKLGVPVFSLYGETRRPHPTMLDHIDVMVMDLQDVGSRYYTFIWTMELCMQACVSAKKSLMILDRPNPLGGESVEGTVLDINYASFVGNRPLPVRHGMTVGEIALYLKDQFYPSLDLHIIAMENWKRTLWFDETFLPWVMPSPNMPLLETAVVYPGMCLLEGTLLSEGRGTTRPFEIFGAPFIDPETVVKKLNSFKLPGVIFRPHYFQPTFQKHAGKLCGGAQLHVTDRKYFKPFKTGAAILKAVYELYPNDFCWKEPPYEYEVEKMPIDILSGTNRLREEIERGQDLQQMEVSWQEECQHFNQTLRNQYLIYA